MKDSNTTFKTIHDKQLCDPNKLKEHFETLFKICPEIADSIELEDAPCFIRQHQDIIMSN